MIVEKHDNDSRTHLNNNGMHLNHFACHLCKPVCKEFKTLFKFTSLNSDAVADTQTVNLNINALSNTRGNIRSSKLKGFTISHLNIRSLIKHINELRLYFEKQQFDVITKDETILDQSIPDHEMGITGYDVVRKVRNQQGRVVAIFLKVNTPHGLRII